MDVRVTRPLPTLNTVETTAHLEGDHAQDHGVRITATEESADKTQDILGVSGDQNGKSLQASLGKITNKIHFTHFSFVHLLKVGK